MKRSLLYIFYLLAVICFAACTEDIAEDTVSSTDEKGIGQMVMFSSGTTDNVVSRANANSRYMPNAYRFVCRMYYKAQTGSEKFDVSGNTDQTAWLKVDGNLGNSLYWNRLYSPVSSEKGPGGIDDYGNDYNATAFYWQNRKEHAFLAWTNLNNATGIVGGEEQGKLKFKKDMDYRVYSNETVKDYELDYYEIYGVSEKFSNQEDMEKYVREHGNEQSFKDAQTQLETSKHYSWTDAQYIYRHGKQIKWSSSNVAVANEVPNTSYDMQWYQEYMYFETLPYTRNVSDTPEYSTESGKTHIIAYLRNSEGIVAKAELKVNDEGKPVDAGGNVIDDPSKYVYSYAKTDVYGNLLYDETKPEYTFYFSLHRVMKEHKRFDDYPCLAFDLTRGSKTSMAQQPDIAQALTLQAPSGATQESNRVNLYFRHMFSQIQVNVKNSADNSVTLQAGDIQRVDLLGVSEEGYVFTDLDEDGNVHAAAYKEIDFSKYNEQQLLDNSFGTSFQMFKMPDEEIATGYLKSFNCITFGQLQAIRITWKETGEGDIIHASTFRIPNPELVNLQSGTKYIWNIEIRRGTLAIIRTEIVDWELPDDEKHNTTADGTIQN